MGDLKRLVARVLALSGNEDITYYYDRVDYGTVQNPDVVITKCVFRMDASPSGKHKDLVAVMYKGDDECWYASENEEIYRMPFFEDPQLLESILREISRQSHSGYAMKD